MVVLEFFWEVLISGNGNVCMRRKLERKRISFWIKRSSFMKFEFV